MIYFLSLPLTNPLVGIRLWFAYTSGTNGAQADKIATKMSTVAAIDAIVRIVCKRFQGFSNPALACAISFSEALLTSDFASLTFKGTFPTIVKPNEPTTYITEEAKSSVNCIWVVSLCRNAVNGNSMTGPIKLTKKRGF
jgi:hypothetical protein